MATTIPFSKSYSNPHDIVSLLKSRGLHITISCNLAAEGDFFVDKSIVATTDFRPLRVHYVGKKAR